ncbi:hypothetical protein ACLBXM_10105 [Xanthobacteraceae bacterium A53D]
MTIDIRHLREGDVVLVHAQLSDDFGHHPRPPGYVERVIHYDLNPGDRVRDVDDVEGEVLMLRNGQAIVEYGPGSVCSEIIERLERLPPASI